MPAAERVRTLGWLPAAQALPDEHGLWRMCRLRMQRPLPRMNRLILCQPSHTTHPTHPPTRPDLIRPWPWSHRKALQSRPPPCDHTSLPTHCYRPKVRSQLHTPLAFTPPPSAAGTLLLYDQEKCPDYRRDGYEWKKVKVRYTLKGEARRQCKLRGGGKEGRSVGAPARGAWAAGRAGTRVSPSASVARDAPLRTAGRRREGQGALFGDLRSAWTSRLPAGALPAPVCAPCLARIRASAHHAPRPPAALSIPFSQSTGRTRCPAFTTSQRSRCQTPCSGGATC